jgi:Ferritin-like domain
MEISEGQLRRMVREVDDIHREGMESFTEDNRELIFGDLRTGRAGTSRRRFLAGAAGGGALLTVGSVVSPIGRLVTPAAAQGTPSVEDLAVFAASVEYAAVAAYGAAAESGKVTTPAVGEAATLFADHHQQHGDGFAALVQRDDIEPNPGLLEMVGGQIADAADEAAVLEIAYGVENAAAATYLFALGVLDDIPASQTMASILPVEAQHAITLGFVLGKPLDDETLMPAFETTDAALDPADFPAA